MVTQKKSSGLGGGLWFVLVVFFGGGIFFLIKSILALKSGGTRQLPDGSWVDVSIGLFDTNWIYFALIAFACGIASYFAMRSER
jgi:hypothetical protein